MKTSSRALVWVILVFAAGIVFGTALTLLIVRPDQSLGADVLPEPPPQTAVPAIEPEPEVPPEPAVEPPPERPSPTSPSSGLGREIVTRRIIRYLQLDAEQERAVRQILERSRQKQQAAERQRRQDLDQIRRQTLRQIRSELRPDQQRRLEQMLLRLQRQRQQRRGR